MKRISMKEMAAIHASQQRATSALVREFCGVESDCGLKRLPAAGPITAEDVFWAMAKSSAALKAPFFREIILSHLDAGDVDFFIRLGVDLKRKPATVDAVKWTLALWWTSSPFRHGFCVCSDAVITDCINSLFGTRHNEQAIRKIRQRLTLKKAKSVHWRKFIASKDGASIGFGR